MKKWLRQVLKVGVQRFVENWDLIVCGILIGLPLGICLYAIYTYELRWPYFWPIEFIEDWQTLLGSLIGASAPILGYLVAKFYYNRLNQVDRVIRLLGAALSNFMTTNDALVHFRDQALKDLLTRIDTAISTRSPFAGMTFYPLVAETVFEDSLLDDGTGNQFLDSEVSTALNASKNFSRFLQHARVQFEATYPTYIEIIRDKIFPADITLQHHRADIVGYVDFLNTNMIRGNVRLYADVLVRVVAFAKFRRRLFHRPFYWDFKFNPHFRYFKNSEDYRQHRISTIPGMVQEVTKSEYTRLRAMVESELKT